MSAPATTQSLKLGFPIRHAGKEITEVTLRRPKVADVITAQRGASTPAEIELAMVAQIIGLPQDAVAQMDLGDYMAVQNALKTMATG
jgi:hypothetical protein